MLKDVEDDSMSLGKVPREKWHSKTFDRRKERRGSMSPVKMDDL